MRVLITLIMGISFYLSPFGIQIQAQANIDANLIKQFQATEKVGFIVLLKDQADLSFIPQGAPKTIKGQLAFDALQQKAQKTQIRIQSILEQKKTTFRPFLLVNAIYTKGDIALAHQLADLPEVKSVMYDTPVQVEESISVDYINESTIASRSEEPEWGLRMIKADSVWLENIKGQGVVVAGQDTGYDWEHPAIKDKYRGNGSTPDHNYNWHDAIHEKDAHFPDSLINPCGFNVDFPCADHGHGTHTMGTMVGYAPDNVIGVAPEAQWIGCRNMDRGWGTPASYIECFEFFLAPTDLNNENPDVSKSPHVINNSWACPESEGCNPENFEIMELVVNNLKSAGIVVVVSAGNSGGQGCGSITTPAAIFENSFSVGATRWTNTLEFNDSIATFSSRGPILVDGSGRMKPEVSAPGQVVKSCIPNNGYSFSSGTSMAGPHVVGAVALIISANPKLAGMVNTIERILITTADKKTAVDTCGGVPGSLIPNNTYGYGRINVYKAVQMAKKITTDRIKNHVGIMGIKPNPATDEINVLLTGRQAGKLFFYNALGILVETNQLESDFSTLDVSHFPKGIYFVQFYTDDYQEVLKLIIQ